MFCTPIGSLFVARKALVRDICAVHKAISSGGEVVRFSGSIVFRSIVYRQPLLLKLISDERGTLRCQSGVL